ncbi:ABC transporter permease [Allosphingosinicella indica]|uniref:Putative ABC transport system permease protein n=1 Tax=Allosphingosinicella indica TaxID=941907 RepID=A0A1X7G974_9SPHN|nr:ABC transporter permease [Allosphingosinicella indica]SMF66022.1 putative ABC transport system permease protein [Allosphingosinicella indica]
MWQNYLTVALRALTKNRTFAVVNILGLALGLAACLLLLLYVRYETSYDAWLPDSDRIYQVQSVRTDPETGDVRTLQASHGVIAESLAKDFPQIEAIARADSSELVFVQDGEATYGNVYFADPTLFDILQLPFIAGNRDTAIDAVDTLVLSRSEAMRRFGTTDVVGKTISRIIRGERRDMRITGVFEDIPRNSNIEMQMVSRITPERIEQCGWGCINGYVYLKLKPGASPDDITRGLPAWEKRNIPVQLAGTVRTSEGDAFDWKLVNIRDVHLSGAEGEPERPVNDRRTIITFAIVALLILAMATVNFINLATARASKRAREVALRKVLGANRRQLIFQFLGESLLLTGVAMLIALTVAELTLPMFRSFLNAGFDLVYLGANGMLPQIVAIWLFVGIAGGLYPAFYLSRFQPAAVLKANRSSAEPSGTGRLRNVLVVGQFAVSIGLIICTAIVYLQTEFARSADPGYRHGGLIVASNMNRAAMIPVTETLLREVERIDGVADVAATSIVPATDNVTNSQVMAPGRDKPVTIGNYSVTPSFFQTLGTRLLAGRTLSRRYAQDYAWTPYEPEETVAPAERAMVARGINIVVNRLAAEQLGFAEPAAAIGKTVGLDFYGEDIGLLPGTIVGVVENSRFRSIREPFEAQLFYDRGIYSHLIVRYDSADPEAVRQRIGEVWKRLAPEVPYDGELADLKLAELYRTDRARGQTFAGFAILAIVVACLGLFGLAAFTAERRTKEIGIRKVFGARVRDIVQLLAWQFSKPVVIANLVAWPVAWWVMRDWLNTFDARIALTPTPFVLAGFLALVIALGTISGHAIRVARTNPIHALRYE